MNIKVLILAVAMACASFAVCAETPPILIPGYGAQGDGIARWRVGQGPGLDAAMAIHVMSDERVVLGGVSMSGFNSELSPYRPSFMRLLPDGQLDTTFGQGGRGSFVVDGVDASEMLSMFEDPAGDLVYVVFTEQLTGVVGKVTTSGVPVATFGQNGRRAIGGGVFIDPAIAFIPRRLVNLSSGRMLVSGFAGTNQSYCGAIARLTAQGNFDTTFGTNGTVCLAPPGNGASAAGANDVVELADGSLLSVGGTIRAGGAAVDMYVARLSSAGVLDTSFGSDGSGFAFVGFDAGNALNDEAFAVAIDQQGRIVIGGHANVDVPMQDFDMAVARLTPNGLLDTTFGNSGRVLLSEQLPGSHLQSVQGLQILADGRILASGRANLEGNTHVAAAMLRENGALDPRFGVDGRFIQASANADSRNAIYAYLRSTSMVGDHLYMYGGIDLETSFPSSQGFGVTKLLMPLMRDGFDG